MNFFTKIIPTWLTLNKIVESVVGKSLMVISVSVPLAKLANFGIQMPMLNVAVAGALLTLIGWVITVTCIPNRIRAYKSCTEFANIYLQRYVAKGLNPALEFMWVKSDSNAQSAVLRSQLPIDFLNKFSVAESFGNSQSNESAVYYYSLLVYECDNLRNKLCRGITSVIILLGVILLYSSAIKSIVTIIIG